MPRALKFALSSLLIGLMSVGLAYAGAIITPPKTIAGGEVEIDPELTPTPDATETAITQPAGTLLPGQIWAGAAKVSTKPQSPLWEKDQSKCETLTPSQAFVDGLMHVADFRVRWAEYPNCIYMGGYGIGPMNAIGSWDDEYGLWARSVAMKDSNGKAVVLTLLDAVYWEAHYNNLCSGCGFLDLADTLGEELGLPPSSFLFASTHSHTSPDFIGGWGGVPQWYMDEVTEALKTSVRQSLTNMRPATLEAGEEMARQFNGERRDYYRSAEDDTMSWFRLIDAANPSTAIATVGAFAAHPVTADEGPGKADADFPAVFAKKVETDFGGVGMFLQTGLGNISPRGNKIEMGNGLASLIPAIGSGDKIDATTVKVGRSNWDQPATNVPLSSLGAGGFFDRKFNELPASVSEGKGPENKKCKSASPLSVNTSVSAAKIGKLWITGGPGELFSNLTNTIEERNPNGITLALGLVNDGLGYIVQSFETDHVGRQGVGFVGGEVPGVGLAEYEDAYSIDHCFGDATLEKTLVLLGTL